MKNFFIFMLLALPCSAFAGPEYGPITALVDFSLTKVECRISKDDRVPSVNEIESLGAINGKSTVIRVIISDRDDAVVTKRELERMCRDLQRVQRLQRKVTLIGQFMSDLRGGAIFTAVQLRAQND